MRRTDAHKARLKKVKFYKLRIFLLQLLSRYIIMLHIFGIDRQISYKQQVQSLRRGLRTTKYALT